MRTFKLTIEYDGTDFQGWQVQGKGERTVQGDIQNALKLIFKRALVLHGSGRTDTGVHAAGQTAHFRVATDKSGDEIRRALNANLEADVTILKVEEAAADFHARFDVMSKTYRYTVLNRPTRCSLERRTCLHFPYKLNVKLMAAEAKSLVGKQDFRSFRGADPDRKRKGQDKDAVRTIRRCEIKRRGDFVTIEIEADGFLYKMVRTIVGTLLDIGTGRLPPKSIARIIKQCDRTLAAKTIKPHGLTLVEVKYK